jgi:hypothetical protein
MIFPIDLTKDERGRALIATRLAVIEAAKPLRRYVERLKRAGSVGAFADSYHQLLADHDRALRLVDDQIRALVPDLKRGAW